MGRNQGQRLLEYFVFFMLVLFFCRAASLFTSYEHLFYGRRSDGDAPEEKIPSEERLKTVGLRSIGNGIS